MSLFFRLSYLLGVKPWDSGISPPELVAAIEGPGALAPGRALDLGCGTGTNCIYLARHGWQTTGVDFIPRAIQAARRKAAAAGVAPRFLVGDVTRLDALDLADDHGLVLDLGCFHSLADAGREAYLEGVTRLAKPGATMLLFCLVRRDKPGRVGPRGVLRGEVERRFNAGWELVEEIEGRPMLGWDAAWHRLRRR
ncbi:MAG: class I SAM-dependent methyltransferase [Candidatus Dormibacterales bacterium]